MHEWGITQDLIDEVKRQAKANKMKRVSKISISLGKLAHLTPQSVRLCFKVLTKKDVMFKSAKLSFKKTLDHKVIIDTIQGKS